MFGLLEFFILLILAFESILFLSIRKNGKTFNSDRIDLLNFLALFITFRIFFYFLFNAVGGGY